MTRFQKKNHCSICFAFFTCAFSHQHFHFLKINKSIISFVSELRGRHTPNTPKIQYFWLLKNKVCKVIKIKLYKKKNWGKRFERNF